jgi:hypothetical protein
VDWPPAAICQLSVGHMPPSITPSHCLLTALRCHVCAKPGCSFTAWGHSCCLQRRQPPQYVEAALSRARASDLSVCLSAHCSSPCVMTPPLHHNICLVCSLIVRSVGQRSHSPISLCHHSTDSVKPFLKLTHLVQSGGHGTLLSLVGLGSWHLVLGSSALKHEADLIFLRTSPQPVSRVPVMWAWM